MGRSHASSTGPAPGPIGRGPAKGTEDVSGNIGNVAEHFDGLSDEVAEWGASFENLEERRKKLAANYEYMEKMAVRLGGVELEQKGNTPNSSMAILAFSQVGGAAINGLWISAFGSELDEGTKLALGLLLQAVAAGAAGIYNNYVAKR